MKYKLNTHYIATSDSLDGLVFKGERLFVKYQKNNDSYSTLGEYTMILPVRDDKTWNGLPQINRVLYFKTKKELSEVLDKFELVYNIDLINDLIFNMQKKIEKLKMKHGIIL